MKAKSSGGSPEGEKSKYLKDIQFDSERGELRALTGDDLVILSGPALRALYSNGRRLFGTGAYVIWYEAGREAGIVDGKRLKLLMPKFSVDGFLGVVDGVYTNLGWGKVQHHDLLPESRSVSIVIGNSPFVRGTKATEPTCAFVKGFLEGLFSVFFESGAKAEEVECAATGKERCVFRISW